MTGGRRRTATLLHKKAYRGLKTVPVIITALLCLLNAFGSAALAADAVRIGYLLGGSDRSDFEDAFEAGLRDAGYEPGRSVLINYQSAPSDEDVDRTMRTFVADKVDAIVVYGRRGGLVAARHTSTIPIIFTTARDAVSEGLVRSLARPGGNVTGQSVHAAELAGKRLQLLSEAFPGHRKFAVLWNGANPHAAQIEEVDKAAAALSVDVIKIGFAVPHGLDAALLSAKEAGAAAGFIISDLSTITHRAQIGEAAVRIGFPLLMSNRRYVVGGTLMSYGPDITSSFRRAAHQTILAVRSGNAGSLPVEQPTVFELVVDLRAAKMLGVSLPPSVLLGADVLIE